MKSTIVFTGGGTSGHVTPNLTLIDALDAERWACCYIGSYQGIESKLVTARGIDYYPIPTGKLRRYWSMKNFTDLGRIMMGIITSWQHLGRIRPVLVFSKGGFVAFPAVFAAWLRNIPVIAHESDLTPGLANRLSYPFVSRLCLNFQATLNRFYGNSKKAVVTGTPIRPYLLTGDPQRGQAYCGFCQKKTTLLLMGGGVGSQKLNQLLRQVLPQLLPSYNVIHLCGPGKCDPQLTNTAGYCQLEYADQGLGDIMALADLVIARSGANTVIELMVLAKPHIFIPLSTRVSRGDQWQNATYFEKQGVSTVLKDDDCDQDQLMKAIEYVNQHREIIKAKIHALGIHTGTIKLIKLITGLVR